MAAQLLVLYNQPNDPAAFEAYYAGTHVPIAKRIPGLRKYSVSRGPVAIVAGEGSYFFVATLEFDDMAAIGAAFASPEGQAAAGDVANFATGGVTMLTYETQEV